MARWLSLRPFIATSGETFTGISTIRTFKKSITLENITNSPFFFFFLFLLSRQSFIHST